MATCLLTDIPEEGVCLGLAPGGSSRMFIANRSDIDEVTYQATGPDKKAVTAITMKSGAFFHEIFPKQNSLGETSSLTNGGNPASSQYYTKSVVFNLDGYTQNISNFIEQLPRASMVVITLTSQRNSSNDPIAVIAGLERGLSAFAEEGGSGVGQDDLPGWQVTLTTYEGQPTYQILVADFATFIAALLAP